MDKYFDNKNHLNCYFWGYPENPRCKDCKDLSKWKPDYDYLLHVFMELIKED